VRAEAHALLDPAAAAQLLTDFSKERPPAGVIYLAQGSSETAQDSLLPELTGLFLLSRHLRAAFDQRDAGPQPFLLCATTLGGDFGLAGEISVQRALSGSVHGFVKTLAHEWDDVRVRLVDLPSGSAADRAARVVAEAAATDDLVEVAYSADGRRHTTALASSTLDDRPLSIREELDNDSVIVLTGGARGITAEIAAELADHARPRLVLVGRTPLTVEEDAATAGIDGMSELKRALIERARSQGEQVAPAAIERAYRTLLAEREVRATLGRLQTLGATVDYQTCDVSDAAAFRGLLEDIYARYGRIDGVVHGAGAIEDKLVEDKDPVSFARVVGTKVIPAQVLAEHLRPESLRFLVFFSSVSARFGNRGQGDYAAANEGLNKLADVLDRAWPARVVAMNWGPWRSTGMVSPEVLQQFESRGVTLIPVEHGRKAFLDEVRYGRKGEPEITIGGAAGMTFAPADQDVVAGDAQDAATSPLRADLPLLADGELTRTENGSVRLIRHFHPTADVFLDDHRIDDVAVLPFAVAMEVMAETALAGAAAGESVRRLREVRLFAGVTLDEDGTTLEITASPQDGPAAEGTRTFAVSIKAPGQARDHYRALVDLSADPAATDAPVPLPHQAPVAVSLTPGDTPTAQSIYRDHLFHGPAFQGVRDLQTMEAAGARALLQPSRAQDCLRVERADSAGGWLLDPVVVDSALQLQLVWSRLHWGLTLLPLELAEMTVTTSPAPRHGLVRHEMNVRADSVRPLCRADHLFLDESGAVLLTMHGMVGAGSAALNRIAGSDRAAARP
jgi:NAD(P)-dependent dehydrogenase (short-subunit alcohol dehydrogenase family)